MSIDWEYDAAGNVSSSATQDYWSTYDSMNRFVICKGHFYGTRGGGTIALDQAGVLGDGDGTGMLIGYNAAGQRTTVATVMGGWPASTPAIRWGG